jgi:glycosyltransferase involved in cell wall biosynthesis
LKKLVVISHTEHQKDLEGNIVGWGPTVNEINFLSQFWEEVVHVACLEKDTKPRGSSLKYTSNKIHFNPIPTFGGKTIFKKFDILWKLPLILIRVSESIKGASHVQLRLPMGIGIFLMPYFYLRNSKKFIFWVKYANNWGSNSVPFGYKTQRWILKKNWLKCRVTINGFWPNQEEHCISMENPCLKISENVIGSKAVSQKNFSDGIEVVFVGRIDESKGVDFIIELVASGNFKPDFLHIVGEGLLKNNLEFELLKLEVAHKFYGTLKQSEIFNILNVAHAIMLPSRSEGFPKVLAEAMNFGCIPITSNVGSICHYIQNDETGIVMNELSSRELELAWKYFISLAEKKKRSMMRKGNLLARKFTFEEFGNRLINEVLS